MVLVIKECLDAKLESGSQGHMGQINQKIALIKINVDQRKNTRTAKNYKSRTAREEISSVGPKLLVSQVALYKIQN